MSNINWHRVHELRNAIAGHEAALTECYAKRLTLIRQMTESGMRQREVGAYWGISNPRICNILDVTRNPR